MKNLGKVKKLPSHSLLFLYDVLFQVLPSCLDTVTRLLVDQIRLFFMRVSNLPVIFSYLLTLVRLSILFRDQLDSLVRLYRQLYARRIFIVVTKFWNCPSCFVFPGPLLFALLRQFEKRNSIKTNERATYLYLWVSISFRSSAMASFRSLFGSIPLGVGLFAGRLSLLTNSTSTSSSW